MKLYIVTYDGTTERYSTDVYLQGVYSSKKEAEAQVEKIRGVISRKNSVKISVVELDKPLKIDREYTYYGQFSTNVPLANYYE